MIVPSIDLEGGQAVQLIGGEEQALDAGDPNPLAERYGRVGEIAVVDLDAALGRGDNTAVIEDLIERAPCRVGGGIRDLDAAIRWLDRGALKIVLGTAAKPELLRQLPPERVIAAISQAVSVPIIASGGADTPQHLVEALSAGADAVLAASIFHDGDLTVGDVKRELAAAGVEVRI